MDNKNNDFDYTIVLDGSYRGPDPEDLAPAAAEESAHAQEPADPREPADRLYYEYERKCLRDPLVLDKDDIYPHTYYWRTGDRYDPGKIAALEEALKTGKMVADTEAYEKFVESVKSRKFEPVSWD